MNETRIASSKNTDLTNEILYATREEAQAQVDRNTNRDATLAEGYEVAFKVVEVTL